MFSSTFLILNELLAFNFQLFSAILLMEEKAMNKKKQMKAHLLNLLEEAYPNSVSGHDLAHSLDVTTRTIRNYVKELLADGYMIKSAKDGYTYIRGTISQSSALDDETKAVLMRILHCRNFRINRIALQNSLNISESTLRRRLATLDTFLSRLDVRIIIKDNYIQLSGSESATRHVIYTTLKQESQQNILTTLDMSQTQIAFIREELSRVAHKYDLNISTGIYNNIVMHIAILIFRLRNFKALKSPRNTDIHQKIQHTTPYAMAEEITAKLQAKFAVQFTTSEKDNVALQLVDIVKNQNRGSVQLKDMIDNKFWLLATLIIHMVDESYNLQFQTNEDFVARFALHIQNLYARVKENYSDQPLVNKNIKKLFPFIYDIAVYASAQLSDIFETDLSESEINLIALHLGTLFMTNNDEKSQEFILIDDNYLGSNANILIKIKNELAGIATITQTYQSFAELPAHVDSLRVISTHYPVPDTRMIAISPFVTADDVSLIKQRAEDLADTAKSSLLATYIKRFLPQKLVFREKYCNSSTEYIKFLSDQLYQNGYVTTDFFDQVLKREKISSTDFVADVAIPHTLKSVTTKTSIAMIINKKKSQWNKNMVHIVVMLALSENDRQEFQSILDTLISTLSDSTKIQQIINTRNYHDIITLLQEEIQK